MTPEKPLRVNPFVIKNLIGRRITYKKPDVETSEMKRDRRGFVHVLSTQPGLHHTATILAVTEDGLVLLGTPENGLIGIEVSFFEIPQIRAAAETAGLSPKTRVVLIWHDQITRILD